MTGQKTLGDTRYIDDATVWIKIVVDRKSFLKSLECAATYFTILIKTDLHRHHFFL